MYHPVVLYSAPICAYCVQAKKLLQKKGVPFQEIDISDDPALKQKMIRLTGRMTVPQILINGTPIGGCDDLYALERKGELDRLLRAGA